MSDFIVHYAIYPSEEICSYSSAWHCLARSMDEAKAIVEAKLRKRYPFCRVAI